MTSLDAHEIQSAAAGRWVDVLISLGIPSTLLDGRGHPCPKCGGRDRFAAFPDLAVRGAVHCRHCFTAGSMIRPGDGLATVRWWTGTSFPETLQIVAQAIGIKATSSFSQGFSRSLPSQLSSNADLERPLDPEQIREHTEFAKSAYLWMNRRSQQRPSKPESVDSDLRLNTLRQDIANRFGVSVRALVGLRVGLSTDESALTWPMRNAEEQVVGVRMRSLSEQERSKSQWSRRGSRSGLFLPRTKRTKQSVASGDLYVTEGGTDTAVAIDLGLWVIGRASCGSSTLYVREYVAKHRPRKIVVIADNDAPGRRGAKQLAKALVSRRESHSASDVHLIVPPEESMDLRDWVKSGATRLDILNARQVKLPRQPQQKRLNFECE